MNYLYNEIHTDEFPLKNIQKLVNDNYLSIGIECDNSLNSVNKFIGGTIGQYIENDHTTLTITGNIQCIKNLDNDLSIVVDGCDNSKQLTLDLQSQIDELTDKLNNVISKLDKFNKNIEDVKKEISSEANNDILYSNAYEYCLKIIENKFA